MEKSAQSGIVPKQLGFFHTQDDPLSWQYCWGFCRLVQEARVLQWLHAIFLGSWHYGISLSKDNFIHIQFHLKIQNKPPKQQQYSSYFKIVLCQDSSLKIVLNVFPVSVQLASRNELSFCPPWKEQSFPVISQLLFS